MNYQPIYPAQWKKGYTVIINGVSYMVNSKPKKAIDGSYLVFLTDTAGKVSSQYIKNEQVQ